MRVLHVVGDSKWGGGGAIIMGLAQMARDLGWQAEILITDPVSREKFESRGIGVVPLEVIWRNVRPFRDLRGLLRLHRYLRTKRYDLVHTHTSKAGFVGRIAARLAGVPVVIHTAHSFSFHEDSGPVTTFACRALETFAAFFCDRIVTVSHYHRDWGLRLRVAGSQKMLAIQNGIQEPVRTGRSRDSIRAELGIEEDELLVFTPGRLFQGKGLDHLINALPQLARRLRQPFRLALAGDGALRPMLEKQAAELGVEDRVLFLGFRTDIADLLDAADIVVLPSLHEGMSIALLEAMASQKAIVATNIGGNFEATCGGDGAMLVPPGQTDALADAITELAADPARRESIGLRARHLFEQNHTESIMLSRYRRAYLSLTESADKVPASAATASLWHPKDQ